MDVAVIWLEGRDSCPLVTRVARDGTPEDVPSSHERAIGWVFGTIPQLDAQGEHLSDRVSAFWAAIPP